MTWPMSVTGHLWQARTGVHAGRDWCPVCRTVRIPTPLGYDRPSYLVPGATDWIAREPPCPPEREAQSDPGGQGLEDAIEELAP